MPYSDALVVRTVAVGRFEMPFTGVCLTASAAACEPDIRRLRGRTGYQACADTLRSSPPTLTTEQSPATISLDTRRYTSLNFAVNDSPAFCRLDGG